MARGRALNVAIDVAGIERLSAFVARIEPEILPDIIVEGLNEAATEIYDLAQDRMNADINLSDEYLRSKMEVEKASRGVPVATITARSAGTTLGRFDAKPVVVDAKGDPKNLKGNRALGIAPGKKQAGVTVQVRRSGVNDNFTPRGYILPLRAGTEAGANGWGVFARRKSGNQKHRYGPAVYQLFGFQADNINDEASQIIEDKLVNLFDQALVMKGNG